MQEKTDIARKRIRAEQEIRIENIEEGAKGSPLEVGDIVRYKLEDSEKQRYGGKKTAPRKSSRYQVVNKIGMWIYRIRPMDGKGQEKVGHFNELLPTEIQQQDVPERGTPKAGTDRDARAEMSTPHQQGTKQGVTLVDTSGAKEPQQKTQARPIQLHSCADF